MHKIVDVEVNLLHENDHQAAHNRQAFDAAGVRCFNLMSSPGAGKTALLEAILESLVQRYRLAVIEGDMTTQLDADRLRRFGVPVIPITTGRACHLDAVMVRGGITLLEREIAPLKSFDLLLVENVGNLVCPAEFTVGEHAKVALLSVTEGEDKPLKYPIMFRAADCIVITKTDLLPYLPLDPVKLHQNLQLINPTAPVFWVSVQNRVGLDEWLRWIDSQMTSAVTVV